MPKVPQKVTDDSIKVRQVSHYQFSWVAGEPRAEGVFTLQLVLDEGAWEEVLTATAADAKVLQGLLTGAATVYYDIERRTFDVRDPGSWRLRTRGIGPSPRLGG